ncbi:MAG: hypothetical protein IJ138_09075 [Clostridia bacterium]|nr:hypothetical protein [Clostridia bacterium]
MKKMIGLWLALLLGMTAVVGCTGASASDAGTAQTDETIAIVAETDETSDAAEVVTAELTTEPASDDNMPPEPPDGMGTPPDGMGTPPDGMGTPPDGMGEPPAGDPPERPDGMGEPPSGGFDGNTPPGGSTSSFEYTAATEITSADTQVDQTYESTTADESALII